MSKKTAARHTHASIRQTVKCFMHCHAMSHTPHTTTSISHRCLSASTRSRDFLLLLLPSSRLTACSCYVFSSCTTHDAMCVQYVVITQVFHGVCCAPPVPKRGSARNERTRVRRSRLWDRNRYGIWEPRRQI